MSLSRAQRKDRKRRELIERGKPSAIRCRLNNANSSAVNRLSYDPNKVTLTFNGLVLSGFLEGRTVTVVRDHDTRDYGTRVHRALGATLTGSVSLLEHYGPPRSAFADPVSYVAAMQYVFSARKVQRWLGDFVLDDEQLLELFVIIVMEQARLARADTTGRKRLAGQSRALARWLGMVETIQRERQFDEGVVTVLKDCVLEGRWDEVEELRGRLVVRSALTRSSIAATRMIADDPGFSISGSWPDPRA